MNLDKEIFNLIEKENTRQINGVELIAPENFVSEQVKQVVGSCLTNNTQRDILVKDTMEARNR